MSPREIARRTGADRKTVTRLINAFEAAITADPDMGIDDVADQSGFSSRTTFFRNFKAVTGMTPQEWKRENVG